MANESCFDEKYDVIIIGGALAGMSAAMKLAKDGSKVLILERHNLPGGVATSFVRSGIEMEATLHEMMSIGPKEAPLFIREYLNGEMGLDLDWLRVPEAYRFVAKGDGVDITLHAGKDENGIYIAAKEIDAQYPGHLDKVDRLLKLCEEVYNSTLYLNDHTLSKLQLLKHHEGLAKTAGYTALEVMDSFGLSDTVKNILSAYWIYVGQPVSSLPFTIYAFLMGDYMLGGSYVLRGFSHELAVKMAKKCLDLGVQIEYGQTVEKILVRGGEVQGVITAKGDTIYAPYVISAPYQETVYKKMIEPASEVPEKALKLVNARKMSVSVFSVILLLDESPEKLGIKDYSVFSSEGHFDNDRIWADNHKLGGWDYLTTICLNYANPECVPEGMTSLSITNLPLPESFFSVKPDEYHEVKRRVALEMIGRVERTLGYKIQGHIVDLEIEAPMTNSRFTGDYQGGVYGYQHCMEDSIVARLDAYPKEHYIRGLTWGASHALTGDGMSININNGRIAAKVVQTWMAEDKEGK